MTIDTTNRSPEEIINEILQQLKGRRNDESWLFRSDWFLYVQCNVGCFPEATLMPYASIPACLKAIEQQVAWSIIPIENTIEGTVNASIDYLYQAQLPVQAELVLPIQQQLMVAKESSDLATKSENFITSASISSIADVSRENFPEAILKQHLQQLTPPNTLQNIQNYLLQLLHQNFLRKCMI